MSDGWRKFWTILLGVVFVLSFVVFVLGFTVRRDLLQPALYSEALAENRVFERVYTDVLADPAVQDQFRDLTGIRFDLIVEELYAQIVGGLYLILPPPRMQAATDRFFSELTAYLRGDTDALPEDVEWGSALTPEALARRITNASTNVIVRGIDRAVPAVVERTEPFVEDEVMAYIDEVSGGRLSPIPSRFLRMGVSGMTRAASDRIIDRMLGPAAETASPEVRQQMRGALAANDLVGAISIAVSQRLQLRVTERLTAAEPVLAQTQTLIGISGAAAALGQTRDQVVAGLNTARGYVALLRTVTIVAAILMLVCMVLIIWLNADDLAGIIKAAGWTLVAASGLVMLLWLVVRGLLAGRISTALGATAAGPASLDAIIDDVVGSLLGGVWSSVWTTALPWLIIGAIALLIGYSRPLLDAVRQLLEPVAEYKWTVLAVVFAAIVLVPLVWRLLTADARAAELPCNGHAELCDRPINEVAFAASHNAMSIADYGWVWPMHDGTISDQLAGGVRALLVDTHDLSAPPPDDAEYLETYPEEGRQFARDLIASFQPPPTDRIVLCHEFCALGYSYFDEMLVEVRTFLEENPREVLFMIIQDATTPEATTGEIEAAGLLPYVYTHEVGQPWPTLREMIDADQRLIVLAEEAGPPPAWYGNAWDVTQETPYTFIFPDQFSCAPNRGTTDNPFFLLNHWIQRGAPNRVDGNIVNAYDFLLARSEQCTDERSKMPNLVAINWWSQGDLMDVVDTLNEMSDAAQP